MAEVMNACLAESTSISPNLIAALLMPLLPTDIGTGTVDRPRSRALAAAVISASSDKLVAPLAQSIVLWRGAAVSADAARAAEAAKPSKPKSAKKRSAKAGDDDDDDAAADGRDSDNGIDGHDDAAAIEARFSERQQPFIRRDVAARTLLELAPLAPDVLQPVLAAAEPDLDSDVEAVRVAAASLIGRVFALPQLVPAAPSATGGGGRAVPLAIAFGGAFTAWMRRFRDKSPTLRRTMVELAGVALRAHEALAPAISTELSARLKDEADDVRNAAVIVVCDSACATLSHVPVSLLRAAGDRVRDRRAEVRLEAATGVAQAYAAHVPGVWQRAAAAAAEAMKAVAARSAPTGVRGRDAAAAAAAAALLRAPVIGAAAAFVPSAAEGATLAKLGWLPAAVLAAAELPDGVLRLRVVQLLDGVLLPEELGASVRARGLVSLYASLGAADGAARRAFHHLLSERRAAQREMSELLSARDAVRSASAGAAEAAARARQRTAVTALAERAGSAMPGGVGKAGALAALSALLRIADNRVFADLRVLADAAAPSTAVTVARDDLFSRLKMQVASAAAGTGGNDLRAAADVVRVLVRRIAMGTLAADALPSVVAAVCEAVAAGVVDDAAAGLALLLEYATLWPEAFGGRGKVVAAATASAGRGKASTASAASAGAGSDGDAQTAMLRLAGLCAARGAGSAPLVVGALRVLRAVGLTVPKLLGDAASAELRSLLLTLAVRGSTSPVVSKHAVAAACAVFPTGDNVGSVAGRRNTRGVGSKAFDSSDDEDATPSAEPQDQFFAAITEVVTETLEAGASRRSGGRAAQQQLLCALAAAAALAVSTPTVFSEADAAVASDAVRGARLQPQLQPGRLSRALWTLVARDSDDDVESRSTRGDAAETGGAATGSSSARRHGNAVASSAARRRKVKLDADDDDEDGNGDEEQSAEDDEDASVRLAFACVRNTHRSRRAFRCAAPLHTSCCAPQPLNHARRTVAS